LDNLTFVAKVIEFAAWPVAALVIALCLRKELQALIPLIKKFKAGPVEVELEQMKRELEATKTLAASADIKAEVVAAKFDEGDSSVEEGYRRPGPPGQESSPLSPIERQVLKAMCDSHFATRSITGVAKDTGLSKASVQMTYGSLIAKGLLDQTKNKEGQLRWFVTALGRTVASES
jgi:hypothetical protein